MMCCQLAGGWFGGWRHSSSLGCYVGGGREVDGLGVGVGCAVGERGCLWPRRVVYLSCACVP